MTGSEFKSKIVSKLGSRREVEIVQAINENMLPNFLKPENFVEVVFLFLNSNIGQKQVS